MFDLESDDEPDSTRIQFDLWGHPIKQTDAMDSLRRGMFLRLGQALKRIDKLEARVKELEER